MRILLLYKAHQEGEKDPFTSLMPTGLGYINALLRENGFRSRLANLSGASWKEAERFIASERPDLVGISQFTHNRFESIRLASLAKRVNPSCVVVLGGPHASHRFEGILEKEPSVDAVVLGEGEEAFLHLAQCLAAGEKKIGDIPGLARRREGSLVHLHGTPWADLDALPFPALHYGDAFGCDQRRQLEFIITSRGCPAACRFCSSPRFWGKTLRFRSPRSMVDEIRYIRDTYGLIYFSLRDDTFTARKERVIKFCRLLLEERVFILWNCQSRVNYVDEEMLLWMRRAGCECVQYGVESGSESILHILDKRITTDQVVKAARATRRAGINLSIYLITGVPGETEEDVQATARLIDEVRPHDGQVSPLAYYPGTALFADAVKAGRVREDLFETSRDAALFARQDPFVVRASDTLLRALERAGRRNRFTGKDFSAQKGLLGYCHATNLMAGEWFEERGQFERAEGEYTEIVQREPDNPWGWLALGELWAALGEAGSGEEAFGKVLSLAPAYVPAYLALGDLRLLSGDRPGARRFYRRAVELNPCDEAARERLGSVDRRK